MSSRLYHPDLAWWKWAGGYVVAVLLPWPIIYLSFHSRLLRSTPLALSLIFIATVARYLGIRRAIASIVSTALCFNYYVVEPSSHWSTTRTALLETLIIVFVSSVIAAFFHQHRERELALVSANLDLQEKTDALIHAQQGSNSAAWQFDVRTRRTTWYEGGREIFGVSLEELTAMGSPMRMVLPEDLPRVAAAAAHTERTGDPFSVEYRVRWPNGEIHWLSTSGTPLASNPALWRGVTTDVTERKSAEISLVRAEKLAAIGRLASTIAHEINNPLEAVTNLLYLARSDEALAPGTRYYLDQADQELARLAGITRHTLSFVRSPAVSAPVDVSEVIASVLPLFRSKCQSRGIGIHFSDLPGIRINASAGELSQVLINLLSNACDALNAGGRIDVRIAQESSLAVIYVEDDGVGIPAENVDRIFDPFFTTKTDSGTGIGLWVVRELVEKNLGMISVRSGDLPGGHSTCFRMEFPLVSAPMDLEPAEVNA